jgi:hypothetical protein
LNRSDLQSRGANKIKVGSVSVQLRRLVEPIALVDDRHAHGTALQDVEQLALPAHGPSRQFATTLASNGYTEGPRRELASRSALTSPVI